MKNNAIPVNQAPAPAARPTVLIVDDSRLMRVAIKKILKDEFELIEAVDGEEAWARLESEPAIACIFSDLSMPNLDGYGLLARVRGCADKRVQALPFIVITGKEGDLGGLLEEVRGHGATDLVGKPFKSDEIIARTRSLLAAGAAAPAPVVAPEAATQDLPARQAGIDARRQREEQEAVRREAEAARRQAAEKEAQGLREAQEATQRAAEAARRQAAEEEAQRRAAEKEALRLRAEEAARLAAEQKAARLAAEQERLAAEWAARRQAEEEARACEELRAMARRFAEEKERQRREEEEALRITGVRALLVRAALPILVLANQTLRLGKREALDALRKRLH